MWFAPGPQALPAHCGPEASAPRGSAGPAGLVPAPADSAEPGHTVSPLYASVFSAAKWATTPLSETNLSPQTQFAGKTICFSVTEPNF